MTGPDISFLLTNKLLTQGFLIVRLKPALIILLSLSEIGCLIGSIHLRDDWRPVPIVIKLSPYSIVTIYKILTMGNKMCATSGTGTAYLSQAPEFTSRFWIVFMVTFFSFLSIFVHCVCPYIFSFYHGCVIFFWFIVFDHILVPNDLATNKVNRYTNNVNIPSKYK